MNATRTLTVTALITGDTLFHTFGEGETLLETRVTKRDSAAKLATWADVEHCAVIVRNNELSNASGYGETVFDLYEDFGTHHAETPFARATVGAKQ